MSRYCLERLFVVCLFFLSLHCADNIAGGGGSQTTNSITVCANNRIVDGWAVPGAIVQLYDTGFSPLGDILPDSLQTIVNQTGSFSLGAIDPGRYNLYSFYDSTGKHLSVFIQSLEILDSQSSTYCGMYSEPVRISGYIIQEKKIEVPSSDTNVNSDKMCILYFKGTPFRVEQQLLEHQSFTLDNVPAGTFTLGVEIFSDQAVSNWTIVAPDTVIIENEYYNKNQDLVIRVVPGTE